MSYRSSLNRLHDLQPSDRITTVLNGVYHNLTFSKTSKATANFFTVHEFSKKSSSDGKSQPRTMPRAAEDLNKYRKILEDMPIIIPRSHADLATPEDRQVFINNMRYLQKHHMRDFAISELIMKFQIAAYCFAFLALLGLAAAILTIAIKKVVGIYLVTFLIWILCCISLFITSKLIICEWKRIRYGRQ